jgi:acyl-coenzyme A synthetase/AMP-(fatty) acid ligase
MRAAGSSVGDERLAVVSAARSWTYPELGADVLALRGRTEPAGAAALQTSDAGVIAAALVALEGWSSAVHLLPPSVGADVLPAGVTPVDPFDATAGDGEGSSPPAGDIETRWVVYTSGTTGQPKPIEHTKASLTRTVVRSAEAGTLTWGLLYDPNRMAGLQVLHQALATDTTVVAPDASTPLGDRISELVRCGVDALSATPTLWRLILQHPAAREWPLRRITLGGEIADQQVLDALTHRYPDARITHVFAATETGAAFSVTDRRAGFPVTYLSEPPRGIRLDVREGILHVHSPGVSAAAADGFASTGDIVEIVGDRVLFKGRASGVVNVGGVNVWPEEVEQLLRDHPEVADAAVTPKPNPISGHVLTARVVPARDSDTGDLPKRLRTWMRARAPRALVPATIVTVASLGLSETGKATRT